MAESKSSQFLLYINAHSEKVWKFDPNPINRLPDISEWRGPTRPRPLWRERNCKPTFFESGSSPTDASVVRGEMPKDSPTK
jgi:hypothetical protein